MRNKWRIAIAFVVAVAVMVAGAGIVYADNEMVFYPDAHPESDSVDGSTRIYDVDETWAWVIGQGESTGAWDEGVVSNHVYITASTTDGKFIANARGVVGFSTSGLPDDCDVVSAELWLYGDLSNMEDAHPWLPDINVYGQDLISNTEVAVGDYDGDLNVAFCDSAIGYADWNTGTPGEPNVFDLNSAGLEYISKTGVTVFCIANGNYDKAGIAPEWGSGERSRIGVWCSEKGEGFKPKLVVNYTSGPPDCPTGLTGEKINIQELMLSWDTANTTDYYTVRGSYDFIPSSNTSGYLIYTGDSTNCTVTGLDLNSTLYYFSLFNIASDNSSTCLEYIEIGGEDLEVDVILSLDLSLYVFIATLAIMFIAFFIKSPFMSLAVFFCTVTLAILPDFTDTPFQNVMWAIMAWSVLATLKRFMDWRGE